MSEPKLISPMLDNFSVGDAISEHNGVCCCPAIDNETNDRYIVKIISLPATSSQIDALLLSGAYSNIDDALSYFKTLSDSVLEEAEILEKLASFEGFVPFKSWQVVPKDDNSGYDVYLLGTYKKTLQRYLRKNPMTHLGALNLGLDLCAAMAICRKSGYLYVDLKPDNIFITGDNEFRIGDLGFVKLNSLRYTSLSDRYRSVYTAPEVADAFSSLNTTIDVYAIGLILYQVFNDGVLPSRSETDPTEDFPAPAYADYEMAEIILKACAADPDSRWQDPIEMGQALVAYMQRNGAHDTPITPVVTESEPEEDIAESETADNAETEPLFDADTAEDSELNTAEPIEQACADNTDDIDLDNITEDQIYTDDGEGNLTFISDDGDDETLPTEDHEDIDYEEVTDEVSDMLNQADDLISHPTPDPVVQPEPIDVPVPEPISEEEPKMEEVSDASEDAEAAEPETNDETESVEVSETTDEPEDKPVKSKSGHWLGNAIIAILVVGLLVAGFFFYRNYYLQPIESIILEENDLGKVTVLVSTKINEGKLAVICSDTYGNQLSAPVQNGRAVINGLAPNSAYTVKVVIDGFHKLTGDTSAAFTTPSQTNIVQFRAVTGAEDGSAIVGFTVEGPDADQWKVSYYTDGEESMESVFSGHMTTITGLTVGNTYTFVLSPVDDLHMTGVCEIKHTANKLIKAENLVITGCTNGTLTAAWSIPEDVTVESWTVRCYSDENYDETIVVNEQKASFTVPESTEGYTVEVTAAGMSVNERTFAPANAITVTEFACDDTDPMSVKLTWNANGYEPADGWIVQYSYDGSATQEVTCDATESTVTIQKIPDSTAKFTLLCSDGTPILGGTLVCTMAEANTFNAYSLKASNLDFSMCKTPSQKNWDRYDLKKSDYTAEFTSGTNASFLVHSNHSYSTSRDSITTQFVVRDSNGIIVSTSSTTAVWRSMWKKNYCELDIPELPKDAGSYTISVYFNGMIVHNQEFTIV